jgi:hypothetical protein
MKSGKITLHVIDDPQNAATEGRPDDHRCGDACMTQPTLEPALRRAASGARRGWPLTAADLRAGTGGVLLDRPEHRDLAASLPGGEEVRVQLSPARRRVTITRTAVDHEIAGSADLPQHLVERAG